MPLPTTPTGTPSFPNQSHMLPAHPIFSMYGNTVAPPHMPGIVNAQIPPEMLMQMQMQMQLQLQMQMQMQMQMQFSQGAAMPVAAAIPGSYLPALTPWNQSSDEEGCSGNNTISPLLSKGQLAENHGKILPQYAVEGAVSPHTIVNVNPIHAAKQSQTPQPSEISSYAINNLLSSQCIPRSEGYDEKENATIRRNTFPTTSTPALKKRRNHSGMPVAVQSLPQFPHFSHTSPFPAFAQNFAVNPYNLLSVSDLIRRDQNNRCLVCGDSSSGLHYGAQSCEGCKGFFKRTVSKQQEFVCAKGEEKCACVRNCAIDRGYRTRCQACRFKQCLSVVMDTNNVTMSEEKENSSSNFSDTCSSADLSPEVSELVSAFVENMKISNRLVSRENAIKSVKKFIRSVPPLNVLFPEDADDFDAMVQRFIDGLFAIRAAFTYDPVLFNYSPKFTSTVEMLRKGIRNTVLDDTKVALLSAIHILHTIDGDVAGILKRYCRGLRNDIELTPDQEVTLYYRLMLRLKASIDQ